MLEECPEPLGERYDLAMLDLDGVVYIGPHAVPGAADHLSAARAGRLHLAFVTNNAARPPRVVAAHLRELGIHADDADVVTSAQAAAHLLATRHAPGSPVFCLGAQGLEEALLAEGLRPVTDAGQEPVAVVTGYGPDVPWRRVMRAAMLVRGGLPWVACNADATIPTPDGPGPGHGVQVRMIADFAGVAPTVAGKPARHLLDETVRRVGGTRPLMVGDRLDTDVEGAHHAGMASLLVMTGVTGLAELAAARPGHRPTYVAADLGGLLEPQPPVVADGHAVRCGGWQAETGGGRLRTTGSGSAGDWWRAVAVATWQHLDRVGEPCDTSGVTGPPDAGPPAARGTVSP